VATDLGRQEWYIKLTYAIDIDEVAAIYQKAFIGQLETYMV